MKTMNYMNKHKIRHSLACVVAAAVLGGGVAHAGPPACNTRVNNTFNKLLECVTIEGVSSHLNALQTIADTHGSLISNSVHEIMANYSNLP